MISIDEFKKIELRIGKIEKVEEIPESKNLYKLLVDFGDEKKQIISGIKKYYKPDELEGNQFLFVVNLEERKIMNQISQGMILCAVDDKDLVLLIPQKPIKNGSKVS
jgi:methionine--tRNA ligase beta chain